MVPRHNLHRFWKRILSLCSRYIRWGHCLVDMVWTLLALVILCSCANNNFLIVVTTLIGVWTSNVMEKYWGEDPRAVVIDEYVGTWIPLLVAPSGEYTIWLAIIGFALFRLIDIFKPLGCRWIDQNIKGGWGVMLDDVLAGFYALLLLLAGKSLFL